MKPTPECAKETRKRAGSASQEQIRPSSGASIVNYRQRKERGRWGDGEPAHRSGTSLLMCYVLGVSRERELRTWRTLSGTPLWIKSSGRCAPVGHRPTVLRCNDRQGGLGSKVYGDATRISRIVAFCIDCGVLFCVLHSFRVVFLRSVLIWGRLFAFRTNWWRFAQFCSDLVPFCSALFLVFYSVLQ